MPNKYVGFSTKSYEERGGSFSVYDVKCVEEDLLRAIFTTMGDRINMPTYGTRIKLQVFELNDAETINTIYVDLMKVFAAEPRVTVNNLDLLPDTTKNVLIAVAKLTYLEFNVTQDLYITLTT